MTLVAVDGLFQAESPVDLCERLHIAVAISEHAHDCLTHCLWITARGELAHSRDTNRLACAGDIGGNDWCPTAHRFDLYQCKALSVAREGQYIGGCIEVRYLTCIREKTQEDQVITILLNERQITFVKVLVLDVILPDRKRVV